MGRIIFITVLCLSVSCTTSGPKTVKEVDFDILEYISDNPHKASIIHYPDGSTYRPKYGDMRLEEAEKLLAEKYERPWTVAKVVQWYQGTNEPETRSAFLWLLAASRDERAIPYLGSALDDSALEVRIAATYGIMDYFMETAVQGGTEQHMMAAHKWWEERKSKYAR